MCTLHVLAMPYPAQGHVIPLLEFSQCLARRIRVTFVNTEYKHKRVNALEENKFIGGQIRLVSIPDGMKPGKLSAALNQVLPEKLEELIEDINREESDKITCFIVDGSIGWATEVAEKMKIRRAVFWPASAAIQALSFSIPNFIDDGIIDKDGYFWPEDSTCLKWLDEQPPQSVIYVAFGSFTVFDQIQFQELALGLELTNRPFLWVVRPDITDDANEANPEGFQERVAARGQMVGWAPQQKVKSPFYCLFLEPLWLEFYHGRDESEIITREEIKNKVDQLLGDESYEARAMELKDMALESVTEGGHSNRMLSNFVEWINLSNMKISNDTSDFSSSSTTLLFISCISSSSFPGMRSTMASPPRIPYQMDSISYRILFLKCVQDPLVSVFGIDKCEPEAMLNQAL
ncbi:hypothetical protein Patl1_21778 [Pistacia atlantica]|uniref:Uncharacterized protein n=1 Tax=Pistacia atlantica TaxID=434234 RepID=A0ACC1BKI9_9ROSI|nr:hypothetical protein Patl1_21778 [Pistacia atlantica]